MKKLINLFFVFLLFFSLANAINIDEGEEILQNLNLIKGSEQAFRGLLDELDNENIDLSKEKEIKLVIKEKANYFNIDLKEEYPNIKLSNDFFLYGLIILLFVLIGIFIFLKIYFKNKGDKNEI